MCFQNNNTRKKKKKRWGGNRESQTGRPLRCSCMRVSRGRLFRSAPVPHTMRRLRPFSRLMSPQRGLYVKTGAGCVNTHTRRAEGAKASGWRISIKPFAGEKRPVSPNLPNQTRAETGAAPRIQLHHQIGHSRQPRSDAHLYKARSTKSAPVITPRILSEHRLFRRVSSPGDLARFRWVRPSV